MCMCSFLGLRGREKQKETHKLIIITMKFLYQNGTLWIFFCLAHEIIDKHLQNSRSHPHACTYTRTHSQQTRPQKTFCLALQRIFPLSPLHINGESLKWLKVSAKAYAGTGSWRRRLGNWKQDPGKLFDSYKKKIGVEERKIKWSVKNIYIKSREKELVPETESEMKGENEKGEERNAVDESKVFHIFRLDNGLRSIFKLYLMTFHITREMRERERAEQWMHSLIMWQCFAQYYEFECLQRLHRREKNSFMKAF